MHSAVWGASPRTGKPRDVVPADAAMLGAMWASSMRRATLVTLAALVGCADDGATTGTEGGSDPSTTATVTTTATTTVTATAATEDTASTLDSSGEPPVEGWQVISELPPELGMAMSVWGPSADQAMIAGGQQGDGPSRGFLLRRGGDDWLPDPLPPETPMLDWIGRAGDDVWTVGLLGTALRREGDAWVPHDTGTTVTLWGVWGSAGDDVWAVGGDGVSEAPTLLRFDGASWAAVALPSLPADAHALFKVWGADAEHVYVAGDSGVLMRLEAGAWVAETPGSIAPFIALWGRGPNRGVVEVVAVGGRSNARVARWDGATWQDTTLMPAGLNGVWLGDDGTATLVGRLGGIFELPAGSLEPVAMETPTNLVLHAVHGFDDGSRLAVGGSFESAPPWVGIVLEHPGEASP